MSEINSLQTNPKTSNTYREHIRKEAMERKTNILHLIFKYLVDNNLLAVADLLQCETQTGLRYKVCDNIDLDIVLQEYQSYYCTKFQKAPKIVRKLNTDEQVIPFLKRDKKKSPAVKNKASMAKPESDDLFHFDVLNLSKNESLHETKLLNLESHSSEWREMAGLVMKQIIPNNLEVTFMDCIGLRQTVETLKEAIVYPICYPQLFEKACTWTGVLLYGPPGTGKTLLAKALACESPSTFINVTSSAFISKWRGDSEKMVKVLFDVAKDSSPATIFIDEVDALGATAHDSNHEASKRFKSELLTQIDGIVQSQEVFVLATTNRPWSIDNALLRRFEKRILVPLPDEKARAEIFRYYFKKTGRQFSDAEILSFASSTENFSGSDLKNVCKEVEMLVVRNKLEQIKLGEKKLKDVEVKSSDVMDTLKKVKACVLESSYNKYTEWGAKFGAT